MSAIYNLEPPTKGKITLKTSVGDIDIELWPKEAPKAVRNFVQLCLEGYYDDTIFHRVIKNFMVQGGDPTGTGSGGESIYGEPFRDEFHTRIKFNHRGLVACANENQPHSNGSQFFVTLEACTHLDRKHTIFGRVVGDSIYNVAHFNELETDGEDRPLEPPRCLGAEVLWNPFEDIVPRSTPEEREAAAAEKRERQAEAERSERKRRKKNLGLLSFGEEAGADDLEAETAAGASKLRSVFDVADDSDGRLVRAGTEAAERLAAQDAAEEAERKRLRASIRATLASKQEEDGAALEDRRASGQGASTSDFDAEMRAKAMARRKALGEPQKHMQSPPDAVENEKDAKPKPKKQAKERQREALAAGKIVAARENPTKLLARQDTSLMSTFERRRLEAKERSRLAKSQGDGLTKLMGLKKRLAAQRAPGTGGRDAATEPTVAADADEAYDGKPRAGADASLPAAWRIDKFLDDYEDEKLDSLAMHRLKFEKEGARRDAMAANFDDDYLVQDPLLERNEGWNRKDGAAKRSNRAWAAGQEGPMD